MSNIQLQRYSCVFISPNTSLFSFFFSSNSVKVQIFLMKEPFVKLKTRENFRKFHIREIKNDFLRKFGRIR